MDSIHHSLDQIRNWLEEGRENINISGISGSARSYFLSRLLIEVEKPCLAVVPRAKDAARFYRELEFFLPDVQAQGEPDERRLYDFPIYDISPLKGLSPHRDVISRRLQALYILVSQKKPVVVTSTEALLLRVLPKEAMMKALEYLQVGEEVNRERLVQKLETNGYQRSSLVEERGDYSVRGGVIDLFPPLYDYPVRLEFWGDQLESIRHFEALGQRSTKSLEEVILLPANEIIMEQENIQRARSLGRLPTQVKEMNGFPGQEAWLKHFYGKLGTLFDYFPSHGVLILTDSFQIEKETTLFAERFQKEKEKCLVEAEEKESPFPELEGILMSSDETKRAFAKYQRIQLADVVIEAGETSSRTLQMTGSFRVEEDLEIRLAGKGRVSMVPLAEKIAKWLKMGARVVLVCRTEQQANRLREILGNYQVSVSEVVNHWSEVSHGRGLSICLGRLSEGFAWPEAGIYVVSEDEIFGPKRSFTKTRARSAEAGLPWSSFGQLKNGDLVVHQDHGIGRYGGLCKMEIEQKVNDFVVIEYACNDRLYIPADRISILQKYIGADEADPKLDQLGGRSWDLAKEKAKKSIREIAKQLVEIYALRKYRQGFAFSRPDNYFREFEATFEHEETPDQIKAIEDVLSDMESEQPMDRLICGDVGFGKTEVAVRAAFKAVSDGKQVAMLVPTTVLAEQHYETFVKRMASHPIRIAALSRFKTRAEQQEIVGKVRSGKVDILIGTHRIVQKDVSFKDLGLLIIDEEQRFGVKQKEALKKFRALVDVLALTATPIPRTLHLSLTGIRDLSIIETPPEDRLPIETYLFSYDEAVIKKAVEFEVGRGGQVFFVHNRVETIKQVANRLMKLVPFARLAIAHGQMKEKDLEETMVRFVRREIDVLVCTTIIESGLDIPSVNTIIISEVDRFGLSQIYQLRGRVGRSDENAYAYLLLSGEAQLTRDAEKRLRALMDFTHLGAGIHLALHDLKIRGGGNILGYAQSGHISTIGYELYLRLIEQAIAELKGEEWREEINPEINVNIPAYVPSDYVSDTDVRLNLYRRLSSLNEEPDLESMVGEMHDRFGPFPEEVSNLMQVMAVRLLLKRIRVVRLDVTHDGLVFTFSPDTPVNPGKLIRMAGEEPNKFQFLSEKKFKVKVGQLTPLQGLIEARRIVQGMGDLQEGQAGPPLQKEAGRSLPRTPSVRR
jgi:transcription-repair coupling factor (superfamily II helicase)